MKKIVAVFTLMAAMAYTAVAQNPVKESTFEDVEGTVELVYRHANAKLEAPTSVSQLGLADSRNSVGFRVGFTKFFDNKANARGNFGVGIEGGATFSGNDDATVDSGNTAIGRAQLKAVYMDNRPDKKFRLGGKLTAGIAREQFKYGTIAGPNGSIGGFGRGQNAWTFGGGVFGDVGEGRTRLRLGLEYYRSIYTKQTFDERKDKHNFEASVGVVF
jgi:hypothetical protein